MFGCSTATLNHSNPRLSRFRVMVLIANLNEANYRVDLSRSCGSHSKANQFHSSTLATFSRSDWTAASLFVSKLVEAGQTDEISWQPEPATVSYTEAIFDSRFGAPVADTGADLLFGPAPVSSTDTQTAGFSQQVCANLSANPSFRPVAIFRVDPGWREC